MWVHYIPMSEKFREDFLRKLEDAFSNTPYPKDDKIIRQRRIDSKQINDSLKGKHWTEIPLDTLISYRDKLTYFTVEGFRFYLPAFIRAAILHPREVDTLIDYLMFDLTPSSSNAPYMRTITNLLNSNPFSEEEKITRFSQVMDCNQAHFKTFFHGMLAQGIYLAPSPYEAGFMSGAHDTEEIERTIDAAASSFRRLAWILARLL